MLAVNQVLVMNDNEYAELVAESLIVAKQGWVHGVGARIETPEAMVIIGDLAGIILQHKLEQRTR